MRTTILIRVFGAATAAAMMLIAAPLALADTVNGNVTVQGTPTSIKQGETKTFTILVGVATNTVVQGDLAPSTVTVDGEYVLGDSVDSYRRPQGSLFNADSCVPHPKTGKCTDRVFLEVKQYAVIATVTAPLSAVLGTYEVVIRAHGDQGLGIGSKPSFLVTVEQAGAAPSVEINSPQNGACVAVAGTSPVSVSVTSTLAYSLEATLNGSPLSIARGPDGEWEATAAVQQLGANALRAKATNAVGSGSATSTFTASYNGFTWLPPVTTARFQRGRTLPVKFRVGDANGLASGVYAVVTLDGTAMGVALESRDEVGPYYQLNITLPGVIGTSSVGVDLADGNCFNSVRTLAIAIK